MADRLNVRVYNVRFGDAILVTVPDRNPSTGRTKMRHILIDVGNAPKVAGTGEGGDDEVFEAVVGDILDQLDGRPLDLYVMTHEHLDHVQGLFYASTKLPQLQLASRLKVRHVWLTASAAPDYYTSGDHPEAAKQKLAFDEMYRRVAAFLAARPAAASSGLTEMMLNNDPTKTGQCVEFLRTLNPQATHYIHRTSRLSRTHTFREAKLRVWAPEEDTADYYGRFEPLDVGAVPSAPAAAGSRGTSNSTSVNDEDSSMRPSALMTSARSSRPLLLSTHRRCAKRSASRGSSTSLRTVRPATWWSPSSRSRPLPPPFCAASASSVTARFKPMVSTSSSPFSETNFLSWAM